MAQVVQNVVGWRGETAGVGENKVGGYEKVRDVFGGDVANDGLVTAGGAVVLEKGLVVDGIDPYGPEDSLAEGGVGGSKVG